MAEPQDERNLGSWNAKWKAYWTPTLDGGDMKNEFVLSWSQSFQPLYVEIPALYALTTAKWFQHVSAGQIFLSLE